MHAICTHLTTTGPRSASSEPMDGGSAVERVGEEFDVPVVCQRRVLFPNPFDCFPPNSEIPDGRRERYLLPGPLGRPHPHHSGVHPTKVEPRRFIKLQCELETARHADYQQDAAQAHAIVEAENVALGDRLLLSLVRSVIACFGGRPQSKAEVPDGDNEHGVGPRSVQNTG